LLITFNKFERTECKQKTAFKTYCIARPYCAYKPKRVYSTKLDSEINAPFLSNEHGDPDFFQVFAKNNLIKNKFEEEKHLKETHEFVLENISVLSSVLSSAPLAATHSSLCYV